MKQGQTTSWNLSYEIAFLDGEGTWAPRGSINKVDRKEALTGYLLADIPTHWTGEELETLRRHAERLLRGCK
jgi:hypothetical protein